MNKIRLGITYSFFYALSTATVLIFIEYLTASVPTQAVLWLSAVFATIIMHLICIKRVAYIYTCLFHNKMKLVLFVTTVFFVVSSSYYSSHTIGGALYITCYFALTGAISLLIFKRLKISSVFVFLALAGYVAAFIWSAYSMYLIQHGLFALSLTIIGSVSGVVYAKYIQKYAANFTLSALESLSIRYYLVILLIPIIMPNALFEALLRCHASDILLIAIVAVFALILPLYLSQKALEYIPYTKALIINALTPFIGLIISRLFLKTSTPVRELFFPDLLIFIATIIGAYESRHIS